MQIDSEISSRAQLFALEQFFSTEKSNEPHPKVLQLNSDVFRRAHPVGLEQLLSTISTAPHPPVVQFDSDTFIRAHVFEQFFLFSAAAPHLADLQIDSVTFSFPQTFMLLGQKLISEVSTLSDCK